MVARELGGTLDWHYVREVREAWEGLLVLKGILSAEDARLALDHCVDGVWVPIMAGASSTVRPRLSTA